MSRFEDNIKQLPDTEWVARLEIYGETGSEPVRVIENTPDQAGSLAIYYKMAVDYGSVCPPGAEKALDLYGEKVDEARNHPGMHPNIDYLFEIIEDQRYLPVRAVPKG